MSKPNLPLLLITVAAVLVAVIALQQGCKQTSDHQQAIDSLTLRLGIQQKIYDAKASDMYDTISHLRRSKDSALQALDTARTKFTAQGKKILIQNQLLREAFNLDDTAAVYTGCDSLSHAIDSIAQAKWDVDRALDRHILISAELEAKDSAALADARRQIRVERDAYSQIAAQYEAQRIADQAALKKAKKGKVWGWVAAGVMTVLAAIKK